MTGTGGPAGSGRAAGTGRTAGIEMATRHGPARAEVAALAGSAGTGRPASPRFLLVLTHGAGGSVDAPDLLAVRAAGLRAGAAVALVTQPYRVRGARAPGSAVRQDEAWLEIIAWLRANVDATAPLIQGGRSNGARVACRTAKAAGASGVIALAFPLTPPGRRTAAPAKAAACGQAAAPGTASVGTGTVAKPDATQSRVGELRQALDAGANVLVLNGDRDPFGIPDGADATRVVVLKGETHSLSRNPAAVSEAVAGWLSDAVPQVR